MKASVFVCLLVILGSIMAVAQSNSAAPTNRAVASKVSSGLSKPDPKTQGTILEGYGKLPLSFEANRGQTVARVKFLARGIGYTLFLTGDEAVFSLRGSKANGEVSPASSQLQSTVLPMANAVMRMKLRHANQSATATGVDRLSAKSNYFVGNDANKWHTNVPTYAKVKYKNIYSGIDLVYYGNQRQLEYDFVVAPGADPRRIQFDVRGAKKISRRADGDLVAQTDGEGEVRWHKPLVYQEKGGTRQEIAAHYVIEDKNRVGFAIADYDAGRKLFIDPLVYSTYLGGSGDDYGYGIAVDSSGNAYVTGQTSSTDFPTVNSLQPVNGGIFDAFVAKLNSTGSALVFATYLGGNGNDVGQGIAVDSSGNAYVTGLTSSSNFPTVNPLQPANGGGSFDAFVAKLNPAGSALLYSTYLGGNDWDNGQGIAVDSSGNAYVTGLTNSRNFPTMNALQPAHGGGNFDAFVAKLNPAGSALLYSTYLGGNSDDTGYGIAADTSGNAFVAGYTSSSNFPTMNALQPTYGGGADDAFVAKFNSTGSALVYSTYLGGSGDDIGWGIAVDSLANAYVTGRTSSTDFPTVNPLQPANDGGSFDAFVAKLNPAGSALLYSTYLGGDLWDTGQAIAVDSSANAYVTGWTSSSNFPTVNPLQPANGGGTEDAFVAKFNSTGSALVYSTYLGASGDDIAWGIAADSSGNAYVTGWTNSSNFPTVNALQPAHGGGNFDAFVAKIAKPSAVVTLVPPNIDFGNQSVGITSSPQVSNLTNRGELKLPITSINLTGTNRSAFVQTNNCTSVPPGGSCKITVTFTPSAIGPRTAAVSITDNTPGSPQQLPLSGTGVLPAVKFSPASLTFPVSVVFTTSPARPVRLTNSGLGILIISKIATTGPFSQSNNCLRTIQPSTNCTISVKFHPVTSGVVHGKIIVTDNATGSPQDLPLTATGTSMQVTPATVKFGTQPVRTNSLPKTITLTNKSDSVVKISSIAIIGANVGDFAETSTCRAIVASGASCFIKVTFKPLANGMRSAKVSIEDSGGGSPQIILLAGTGT